MKHLLSDCLAKKIEKRAAEDLAASNIGGASVLVCQSNEIVYQNHFGTVLPMSEERVSDQTLFRLASMTKPITAAAAMILIDRGVLSLDDTVERFYPSFSSMTVREADGQLMPTMRKITVENLLTHTSGIGSGVVWLDSVSQMKDADVADVDTFVEFLSSQPLSFRPFAKQEYSGVGAFSVLTGIIQKLTDMSYEDFLKKELFAPCDMTDTTFSPSEEQWKRLITMHDRVDGQSQIGKTYDGCVFEFFPPRNALGGAGLISSLRDYFHFAQMLLGGGEYGGNRILSPRAVREMSSPRVIKKEHESWGLSVRVIHDEGHATLPCGSYGWSGAYGTHFWIDPSNEVIAIYMKNSRYDGGSSAKTAANFECDVAASFEKE